jgi:hypothetical protein
MRVRPPNPPCHSPSIGRAARNSPQNIKNKSANFYVENEPLLPLGSTVAGSSRSEPSRLRSLTIHSPPSRCRKAHARALQTPRCVWRLLCLLSRCSQTLAATRSGALNVGIPHLASSPTGAAQPEEAKAHRVANPLTRQRQRNSNPPNEFWSSVAKNASGDSRRHATECTAQGDRPCRPVVSPAAIQRHSKRLP